jgi:hypothetical protein
MEDMSSEWYCAISHAIRLGLEPEDMKNLIEEHWIPKERKKDDDTHDDIHDDTEMMAEG